MENSELSELEEKIVELLTKSHKSLTYKKIKRELRILSEEAEKKFNSSLIKLETEGYIYLNEYDEYQLFPKNNQLSIGEVKKNIQGKVYVRVGQNNVFISESHINGALPGDIVIVKRCNYKIQGNSRGEINKILKREKGTLIFDYINRELIPYEWPGNIEINVSEKELNKLVDGSRVLVKISLEKTNDKFDGKIVTVLGHKDDTEIDVKTIVSNHNVVIDFSEDAMKQAEEINTYVTEEEIKNRINNGGLDLRDKTIFTIDGEGTKDIDDAVSIEKTDKGNYKLGVHIADVGYYVEENSPLDLEARERSTSIYPYNYVIPMLPHKLSNGICSLNTNEDRLAFSCIMEINPEGKIVGYELVDTIINSRKKMAYNKINDIFTNHIYHEDYAPYVKDLALMVELSEILNQAKINRGYLTFGDDDIEFKDDHGVPVEVSRRIRGLSEKMIENFMLCANECVASFYFWLDQPGIYRNHPEPNVENIRAIIEYLGLNIHIPNNLDNSRALQNIMNKIKKYDEGDVYTELMLQSMKRAYYAPLNIGHFGLALDDYTHFTSPIRRYPDLATHRVVRQVRDHILEINEEDTYLKLEEICKHSSEQERVADKVEKEVNQYKMAEYMENHIGDSFEGYITFINHNGITIRTEEGIYGKICSESLKLDGFTYDDKSISLKNSRDNTILFLGDRILVQAKNANKELGKVEFMYVDKLQKHKQKTLAI